MKTSISPAIILVEPQMGENIGAAARAMANFGLKELRLVNPRDGWPNERALAMGVGAFEYLDEVKVFETFEESIADCQFVLATTARPRDMVKTVYTPESAIIKLREQSITDTKTALVFGRERNGLENDEIAKCHGIITVPTSPDFASLNLAQTVLLMAYEWLRALDQTEAEQFTTTDSPLAKGEEVQQFLDRLLPALEEGGFFKSEGLKPHMIKNITNMFSRQNYTAQEVNTLQGILSALIIKDKKEP